MAKVSCRLYTVATKSYKELLGYYQVKYMHGLIPSITYSAMLSTANTVPSDGVRLSLNGTTIGNDGYVDINDISDENAGALLCHTDKTDCCTGSNAAISNWFFPNGSVVGSKVQFDVLRCTNCFSRNRGPSVVRLKRIGTPTERGRFYCQVPDANDVMQTIFVNIG